MNEFIEQAIHNFRAGAGRYSKPERYYSGSHDLAFATQKFQTTFGSLFKEFALNLCPVICDAVRDKLKINGFGVEQTGDGDAEQTIRHSRRIWQRNRMAIRAAELHREALRSGDAYLIVWPDAAGEAAMFPNRATSCTAVYSDESPGQMLWAAKQWQARDKRTRINIFHPDRIERYVSRTTAEGLPAEAGDFVPFANGDDAVVANPYGIVPVFHFANNADIGEFGRSELDAAIPVQDGLNKCVLDMLVAMEFSAFRQRWVAGIEVQIDDATGEEVAPFKSGVDRLWISQNPDVRFGDFDTADLEQFLKVKESFRVDMASVTGTPLHYFMQNTRGFPSGESLRKAEARFLAKVRGRQESFGQIWADAMAFTLRIEGAAGARLITDWEDPAPMSEREILENILLKKEIGISTRQALAEAGYGSEDAERLSGE